MKFRKIFMMEKMNPAMMAWKTLVGRICIAAIFIVGGFMKIAGFEQSVGYAAAFGVPLPELAIVLAIIIELIGGLMIAFGWKTLWAAKALVIFLIVVTPIFHGNLADQAQMSMFLKNLAILGGVLILIVHGSGEYSLDAKLKKGAA